MVKAESTMKTLIYLSYKYCSQLKKSTCVIINKQQYELTCGVIEWNHIGIMIISWVYITNQTHIHILESRMLDWIHLFTYSAKYSLNTCYSSSILSYACIWAVKLTYWTSYIIFQVVKSSRKGKYSRCWGHPSNCSFRRDNQGRTLRR